MRIPKSLLTTLEGLLWAAVGGATTSLIEIRQYMTNWKDFSIDYYQIGRLATAGAVLGGAMFLRDVAQRRNVKRAAAELPPGFEGLIGGGTGQAAGGPVVEPARPDGG